MGTFARFLSYLITFRLHLGQVHIVADPA